MTVAELPHLAVERAVLGVLLDGRHATAWPHAADLTCEHFAARDHRLIWVAIMRLGTRGERIDAGSVASEMAGIPAADCLEALRAKTPREALQIVAKAGLEQGASCAGAVGGFNGVAAIAEAFAPVSGFHGNVAMLRRYRDQRTLRDLLDASVVDSSRPGARDRVESIAGEAIAGLQRLLQGSGTQNLGQALAQANGEALRASQAHPGASSTPRSWGIPSLNELCPLKPGRVYVIAAGSGGGKTSLALQAAQATSAACGMAQVAISAMEMPATDLAVIMAARTLGISAKDIQDNSARLTEIDRRDLRELAEKWTAENTCHVRDLNAANGNTVEAILGWMRQRHQATGGLALGIIDYLQLIEGTNPRWDERQSINHSTRAIKLAAAQMQVPILLLSQFSRKGTTVLRDKQGSAAHNPEPSMSDLKGSSSIEQDADAVIFVHRPDPNARGTHIPVRLIVAKQRQGPMGTVDLLFRGAHQLFEEAPKSPAPTRSTAVPIPSTPSAAEDLFA